MEASTSKLQMPGCGIRVVCSEMLVGFHHSPLHAGATKFFRNVYIRVPYADWFRNLPRRGEGQTIMPATSSSEFEIRTSLPV